MRHTTFPILALTALAACSTDGGQGGAVQNNVTADADQKAPATKVKGTPNKTARAASDWHRYSNSRFDFAIDVPPGFAADPAPQNGDGRVFREGKAALRVFGGHNALGDSFDKQIARASESLSGVHVVKRTDATWRATARDDNGDPAAILLVRPEDGRLVTARLTWSRGKDMAGTAGRALDSLLLIGHAGPLAYRYRPERLGVVPVKLPLPPDYNTKLDATKLIPLARMAKLGEEDCRYGLSGKPSPCSAEHEAGLAFAVAKTGIDTLRDAFDKSLVRNTTLAGRGGFQVDQGAEGSGVTYSFLPDGAHTVVVARRYRDDAGPGFMGVLRDLRFSHR